ncbi:MAG: 3-hydroxyacyl-CoA dehydrogenase/enoyl-CoA hydratase family protein [Deltaproteobacteria bacterium]|nr:MAG: 3-hydroxyacyl-CoA dehydrogenase/enoyl-CoA hydratase family protein [Deltaproteobacteria bacterium]
MAREIRRVAVLGAGVMGSGIAAHLANAGIPCLMLDITPDRLTEEEEKKGLTLESKEVRNRFALRGLNNIRKQKPSLIYSQKDLELIEVGNFDDDLEKISGVDWVVEAVVENLEIKRNLFQRILQFWKPGIVVSSNTSGIAIRQMMEGFPEDFRRHFLVTHFFNPVRYMKLLEIVPGEDTDPAIVEEMARFGEEVLGKGIVYCKDTPNFIGNRIGVFSMMYAMHAMVKHGLTVEEVDMVLGPATGRPRSAAFGTADLVGLDTLLHVADNVYNNLPDDPAREYFLPPDFVKKMVEKGALGRKSGAGFFKVEKTKEGRQKYYLDYNTMEYVPVAKPSYPSVSKVKNIDDPGRRIKEVISGDDKLALYAWDVLSETLLYSAKRIPEISEDIVNIDNAMKWGFNWSLGPFETWDAIGVRESVERMEKEGKEIPPVVKEMLSKGYERFYDVKEGKKVFLDFGSVEYRDLPVNPKIILLPDVKREKGVVRENAGASLYDIGDGVLCLEFHTKMNAIDADIVEMINFAVEEVKKYEGLVLANHADNFSAGANLLLLLMEIQNKNFDNIEVMVREFQNACMRLKYCEKPVVVAPAGMTLGGGAEITLSAPKVRAAGELYMGLVEVGVGLIPAGGGCKEMILRALGHIPDGVDADPLPFLRQAFEAVAMAKVSTSAKEAFEIGYLREGLDRITINRDYLIHDAKKSALAMAMEGYRAPRPAKVRVPGRSAKAMFEYAIYTMKVAGYITEYDAHIGKKLAHIFSGGDVAPGQAVDEQHLLDLEREAFLSLCGEQKTVERIQHMLMKNKPLRN